jgi:DNA-binding NtrC family response regulator
MPSSKLAKSFEVLVVDDEAGARELLIEYFRARGFQVTGAQDGRAAIVALQRPQARFGLVVTDLNLPGADGFAVLHAARQADESCYVVIVTGYASLDSAIRAVRVGAYDYLTKPFSLGQLDVILSRICDRAGLELENRQLHERQAPAPAPARPKAMPAPAPLPSGSLVQPIAPVASVEGRLSDVEGSLHRIEAMLQSLRR